MGDRTIFATPYRYEIQLFGPSFFNWRRRQVDRIKADEENRLGLEDEIARQAGQDVNNHIEDLERRASQKRSLRIQSNIQKEMRDENKTSIIVRRAALRHQMELDYKGYQKELNAQGKAFYFQRA